MKFAQPWGRQRLSFLLEKATSREAKMWKIYVPKKPCSQDTDVSPAQRDEAVRWLTELHARLQLYPETLVLAVSLLDRFLAPIKARPKYLRCIAITCFFLAAKTCEEDECVPSLKDLAVSSNCGCSPSEILRMERIILDKLDWDLHTATALDFLHIFHVMVLSCRSRFLDSMLGLNRSQHLGLLIRRLYTCLADHTLVQLRGSMLALALLTLELETCCPDWLVLTIDLLRKAQIDSSELIRSRELVARSLSTPRASLPPNTVYIYRPLPNPTSPLGTVTSLAETSRDHTLSSTAVQPQAAAAGEERSFISSSESKIPALLSPKRLNQLQRITLRCKASTKRKVEQMEVDDFYDGIKRLYNEDTTAAIQEVGVSGGGGEGGADGSSSCPPLQPVRFS
ncbi:cyclin-I [Nothobranchius furzeri]|uniref:Cyclin-I n=2 Tax=Nothobranchius TaxID=28779 RepID=A0A1A8U969_NOTFU|nr:cyclin-I [Nothobranchius furzeri]KAF7217719.1 cyclin I [Nothobranchius furzeri]